MRLAERTAQPCDEFGISLSFCNETGLSRFPDVRPRRLASPAQKADYELCRGPKVCRPQSGA